MENLAPLLLKSKLEGSDIKTQTEVLFGIQSAGNSSNDDQYYFRVFEILHDLLSPEVYFEWESDTSRQMDTKEITMVRGARDFLEWLRSEK